MLYVTTSSSHPTGAGYFEVHTDDYDEARHLCFRDLKNKWCFIYQKFEDLHELDRNKLGEIKQ